MKVVEKVLLLTVCFFLLFVSAARAEKLMAPTKTESMNIMAQMQTLEAMQVNAMNAATKGSEAADLAFKAYEQTVKLRIRLQILTGVTYADLMERTLNDLVYEAKRVQETGSPEQKQELLNQLKQLKQ